MTEEIKGVALTDVPNTTQRLYSRYLTAVLIDLTVLNLCAEHWEWVTLDSFTISMLAAILLQVLLKATLALEHKVAGVFEGRTSAMARFLRFFSAWLILFGSKFVILGAVDFAFGDAVAFGGPLHGVVAFIGVVALMLVSEEVAVRLYWRLAD